MPSPQRELVTVLLLAAGLLLVLGYRIWVKREWHLIVGVELRNVRDPEGLGRWIGRLGILLGSLTLGAAAVAYSRPDLGPALGSAYAMVVCAVTAILAVGALRYVR